VGSGEPRSVHDEATDKAGEAARTTGCQLLSVFHFLLTGIEVKGDLGLSEER
jgi:hypothetical protein